MGTSEYHRIAEDSLKFINKMREMHLKELSAEARYKASKRIVYIFGMRPIGLPTGAYNGMLYAWAVSNKRKKHGPQRVQGSQSNYHRGLVDKMFSNWEVN